MKGRIASVLALLWAALILAVSAGLAGETGVFVANRDWGSFCPSWAEHVSTGGNEAAYTKAFCGRWIGDFDRAALGVWLNARSVAHHFDYEFFMVPRDGGNACAGVTYAVASWYAGSEWAEGDGAWDLSGQWGWVDYGNSGGFNPHAFNWSEDTAAATKWYAKTYWKWNDNGTPGDPDDDYKELDAARSEYWLDLDDNPVLDPGGSGRYAFEGLQLQQGLFRKNSQAIVATASDVYHSVALDKELIDDLVSNPDCQGLEVGLGPDFDDWRNCWMYTREAAGKEPYLQITPYFPGDATMDAKVGYLDLGILSTNYGMTGATWFDADFSGDAVVGYLDLGILATWYGWEFGGGGQAEGQATPEPVGLALLALGAVSLLKRRR